MDNKGNQKKLKITNKGEVYSNLTRYYRMEPNTLTVVFTDISELWTRKLILKVSHIMEDSVVFLLSNHEKNISDLCNMESQNVRRVGVNQHIDPQT